jgi:hypothetical protein
MRTTAQLTYEKVRFDEAKDVHLVVSLAAPRIEASSPRPPVRSAGGTRTREVVALFQSATS